MLLKRLQPVRRHGLFIAALAMTGAALSIGLGGCKPDQAQGYVPPEPAGVAVFSWTRPSDDDVAASTTGSNRYVWPPAEVNEDAGMIEAITARYDAANEVLSWSVTFGPQMDGSPWHQTQGFWLVLSDGPMPRSLGGDTAQFIFDASGPEPEVTAYVYNGQAGASSYMEGPGGGPADPIMTSLHGPGVLAIDVVKDGDSTTMSFSVDAATLDAFAPTASLPSYWRGVSFDELIGIWFHPLTNMTCSYNPDGYLEQLQYERTGWFDGTDFLVVGTGACCLPGGICVDLPAEECISQGGAPRDAGTECVTTECLIPGRVACCEQDELTELTLQYLGGGCADSDFSQDAKKVRCSGDATLAPVVRVLATDRSKAASKKAKVWFDGEVTLGGAFTLSAAAAGEDKLKNSTFIHLFDLDGNVLQSVGFHTSCSQPLVAGDRFASVRLVECGDDPGDPIVDCCDEDKPTALTLQFVGGGCDEMAHHQDASKVSCSGFSDLDLVRIVATDESNPDDGGKVYFDGEVPLDGSFTLSAAFAGEDKLASSLYVHLYDAVDVPIQSVGFHASCSQPLAEGDRYGSLVLVGCGDEPSDVPPLADCCEEGKPHSLTFEYTGLDCGATSSAQDPSKLGCNDLGTQGGAAHVVADANKSDGPDFAATVAVGELFHVVPIDGKMASETVLRAYDAAGGSLLQEVRFHTSCSQPLRFGDQFGAFRLVACNEAPADTGGDPVTGQAPPPPADECEAGKPAALTLRYVAADCTAMAHGQNQKKVTCAGGEVAEPAVRIVVASRRNHEGRKALVYHDGVVLLGDLFTIDAANAGKRRLTSKTYVLVYDLAGELRQTILFHTSCSQPLRKGDQFGSIVLEEFVPQQ